MAWNNFNDHKILYTIILLILVVGCVAGIVAPSIVIDGDSKLAPIIISSVILFFVVLYVIYLTPSNVRFILLAIVYFGALLGGMVVVGISSMDEGGKIAIILFLSLLFLLSIIAGFSFNTFNQKYISWALYALILGSLIGLFAFVLWSDVVDASSVKTVMLICLGILFFVFLILGFIALKNNTLGKSNILGLNPKYQIEHIKSWGISGFGAGVLLFILVVTVVMLYIAGAYFVDVYKNTSDKSDVDKNFSLVWAILNFVIAAWLTIQTIYLLIALGMMYYDNYKKQCFESVFEDIDPKTGLPRNVNDEYEIIDKNGNRIKKKSKGHLKDVLEDDFKLAYTTTDPTKSGYNDTITQPGKLDADGIFIPAEFLDDDGISIIDKAEVRLALEAYMENHRKNAGAGIPVIIPDGRDVRDLIDFTERQLRAGGVPDDIIARVRERLDEIGGQAIIYRDAEQARDLAVRQEAAAREEAERRIRETRDALAEAETERGIALTAVAQRTAAVSERDEALEIAEQQRRLASEERTRATAAIESARNARREAELARLASVAATAEATRLTTAARDARTVANAAAGEADRRAAEAVAEARRLAAERATLAARIADSRAAATAEEARRCDERVNAINDRIRILENQAGEIFVTSVQEAEARMIAEREKDRLQTELEATREQAITEAKQRATRAANAVKENLNRKLQAARDRISNLELSELERDQAIAEVRRLENQLGRARTGQLETIREIDTLNERIEEKERELASANARVASTEETARRAEARARRLLAEARTNAGKRAESDLAREEALLARTRAETARTEAETARTEAETARDEALRAREELRTQITGLESSVARIREEERARNQANVLTALAAVEDKTRIEEELTTTKANIENTLEIYSKNLTDRKLINYNITTDQVKKDQKLRSSFNDINPLVDNVKSYDQIKAIINGIVSSNQIGRKIKKDMSILLLNKYTENNPTDTEAQNVLNRLRTGAAGGGAGGR